MTAIDKPLRTITVPPARVGFDPSASARALTAFRQREEAPMSDVFTPAQVMTVRDAGDGAPVLAMDSCCRDYSFGAAGGTLDAHLSPLLSRFIGYPAIAALRQNKILSNIIDMQAEDMTTYWVELSPAGEGTSAEYVKALSEIALKKWKVDSLCRDLYRDHLGWDGGCLLYIDIPEDEHRLESPLAMDPVMIRKGSIRSFRVVEAVHCLPMDYDTTNPLSPDYYDPKCWVILGQRVHASRFLHFTTGKLPTLMKPAYNFMGIPLPQQLLPYIAAFEEARCNVLGSINNHQLLGLKTNLMRQLQEGCNDPAGLVNRVRLMQANRTNDGVAVIDKENEDFFQITTPLTELADLSAQQMELIAMMVRYSVTRIFGTPPRGMDASGDNYREDEAKTIAGWQRAYLHDNVVKLYKLIELNEFGRVTDDIQFTWPSTNKPTEKERLEMREAQMRVDAGYIGAANPVIHPEEVRERLAADADSGYFGIELAPAQSGGEMFYEEQERQEEMAANMEAMQPGQPGQEQPGAEGDGADSDGEQTAVAQDAKFREEDHPRGEDGKFGAGGKTGKGGKSGGGKKGKSGFPPFDYGQHDKGDFIESEGGSDGKVYAGGREGLKPIRERKPGVAKKLFDDISTTTLAGNEVELFEKNMDFNALKDAMPEWAEKNGIIRQVTNRDMGWSDIEIRKKGIKETLAHGAGTEKVKTIPALPDLIKSGVYLETTRSHNPNQIGMVSHIFAAKLDIAGRKMAVGFDIKEDMNGKRFYDHELMEMKSLDGFSPDFGAAPDAGGRPPDTRQGLILSVLHKHLSVK